MTNAEKFLDFNLRMTLATSDGELLSVWNEVSLPAGTGPVPLGKTPSQVIEEDRNDPVKEAYMQEVCLPLYKQWVWFIIAAARRMNEGK